MILTYLYINHLVKQNFGRKDGSTLLDYYQPEDLGMDERKFHFYSGPYRLQGSRYLVKGTKIKGLITFFHGIGGGRVSYTHLMGELCKMGYLVYSFDATGSNNSEGPSVFGLGHYKLDLDAFFEYLDKDEEAKGLKRYACGHSWGGYAAGLALDPKYKVEKAVSLAGFADPVSETMALMQSKFLSIFSPLIRLCYRMRSGKYANASNLPYIEKSGKPFLFMAGTDDPVVLYKASGAIYKESAKSHNNITVRMFEGRRHSFYLVPEAEAKCEAIWADSRDITKAGKIDTDLPLVSRENPEVMKAIMDFLG